MQVVQCDQPQPENFFGLNKMANISTGKFATGWTCAVFFDRTLVQRELSVFQVERACRCKRGSVARQSRRQNAIEHVHYPRDHFYSLMQCAVTHRVTRFPMCTNM